MTSPLPESIYETILEWTNEGADYLYDEAPDRIAELDEYMRSQHLHVKALYRRTNYGPSMKAQVGDVIELPRISSWSRNIDMPDLKYEGIPSVKLILRDVDVRGLDVASISPFPSEQEVLLAPLSLRVIKRDHDELLVKPIE